MIPRILLVMVLVAALGLTPLLAMEIHSGKVLAVGKDYVTVRDKMDMDDDRIFVTAETKITRNGKAAKLSDIGIGDLARVDAKEADGKLIAVTINAMMPE